MSGLRLRFVREYTIDTGRCLVTLNSIAAVEAHLTDSMKRYPSVQVTNGTGQVLSLKTPMPTV